MSQQQETPTKRVASCPWDTISSELDSQGSATFGPLLTPDECDSLIREYETESLYRGRTVMERHGYGRGEYRYFAYPLPPLVSELRTRSIRTSQKSPTPGTQRWARRPAFWTITRRICSAVTRRARFVRRRCSCDMDRATSIACIRTSTANTCFHCKWRFCYRNQVGILPGANSSSPSSARGCKSRAEVVPLRQGVG